MKFEIKLHGNVPMVSSKDIAEQFGRDHNHVMTAIKGVLNLSDIVEAKYKAGNGQMQPCILLNERSALIAMPFIGGNKSKEGQVALVDAYLVYRSQIKMPTTFSEALLLAGKIQAEKEALEAQAIKDAPAIEFANAVTADEDEMEIGDYAKLLSKRNHCHIGPNKLRAFLRDKKILMSGRSQGSSEQNRPYQHLIDKGFFVVKEALCKDGLHRAVTHITSLGQLKLSAIILKHFN